MWVYNFTLSTMEEDGHIRSRSPHPIGGSHGKGSTMRSSGSASESTLHGRSWEWHRSTTLDGRADKCQHNSSVGVVVGARGTSFVLWLRCIDEVVEEVGQVRVLLVLLELQLDPLTSLFVADDQVRALLVRKVREHHDDVGPYDGPHPRVVVEEWIAMRERIEVGDVDHFLLLSFFAR